MFGIGQLLRGFGPDAIPASAPALAVVDNGDGTATATITGGEAAAVNTLYTLRVDPYFSANPWTEAGSRTGVGTVTLTLSAGLYAIVVKTDGGAASNVVALRMSAGAEDACSPADVVRHLLIDLALGEYPPTTPWPIYATREPPTPDDCVIVHNTPGTREGTKQVSGEFIGQAGIQVRVRSSDPLTGYAKAAAIAEAMATRVLRATVAVDTASYFIQSINNISDVLDNGREPAGGRYVFTINAIVSLRAI